VLLHWGRSVGFRFKSKQILPKIFTLDVTFLKIAGLQDRNQPKTKTVESIN